MLNDFFESKLNIQKFLRHSSGACGYGAGCTDFFTYPDYMHQYHHLKPIAIFMDGDDNV
ncbi:hypothetical protein JW960_08860 [candidate division KSB1 bacterium]|nr:hypothetical protein [candidate division KSB1 bacterium]